MAVIISRNVVLSSLVQGGSGKPLLGWRNVITRDNISATSGEVTNLANPSTYSRWVADSADEQEILIETAGLVDYVGIARHNLGGALVVVEVYGNGAWEEVAEVVLPGDGPHIIRFDPTGSEQVRIRILSQEPAAIGVLYVGKLTEFQNGILQDHIPLPYSSTSEVVTSLAESGDFLGRIVTNRRMGTTASFMEVDYNWFEEELGPFVRAARQIPFFFAWLPKDRPDDVGFAWLEQDIRPSAYRHAPDNLTVDFDINMGALVL